VNYNVKSFSELFYFLRVYRQIGPPMFYMCRGTQTLNLLAAASATKKFLNNIDTWLARRCSILSTYWYKYSTFLL